MGRKLKPFLSILSTGLLFVAQLALAAPSDPLPISSQMLGGHYSSIYKGPYALIYMETAEDAASCSGVLVGPRHVITAAHCVKSSSDETQFAPGDYTVIVGNETRYVTEMYYNPSYNADSSYIDDEFSSHDLAILILDQAVAGAAPVPVLIDDPVTSGDTVVLYGFGTNEKAQSSGRSLLSNGKYGSIYIDSASGGVLHSAYLHSKVASCSGDSGGALIQTQAGVSAAVALVSAGTTRTGNTGICSRGGVNDDSIFVDLQSAESQNFLSGFEGIQYQPGRLINFKSKVDTLISKLAKARSRRSVLAISKESGSAIKVLNALAPSTEEPRYSGLQTALSKLRSCKGSRKLSVVVKNLKGAINELKALSALGIS